MYPRTLFIILGSIISVLLLVLLIKLLQSPDISDPVFENTSQDRLTKIMHEVNKYKDILDEYEVDSSLLSDYPEYVEESIYEPSDESKYLPSDDTRLIFLQEGVLHSIQYVLDITSDMSLHCINYTEGDTCRFFFQKKWIEIQYSDNDEIYINYYIHHKTDFLIDRDEWVNYEMYLYTIDEKAYVDIGVNRYNLLTDYMSEEAHYFKDQTYLKSYYVQGEEGYQYQYLNLDTYDTLQYSYNGMVAESSYYIAETETHMTFNDTDPFIGFEYQVFRDGEDHFQYDTNTAYLRYNLWHVTGWTSLEQQPNEDYLLFKDEIPYQDIQTHVSAFPTITPYMYLQLDTSEMTESVVDLSTYQLETDVTIEDILGVRVFYFGEFNSILAEHELTKRNSTNREIISSYMLNRDDSNRIPYDNS